MHNRPHTEESKARMSATKGPWANEALLGALKELWDTGLTANQIRARLNFKFGLQLTKSAVLGKIQRLGLANRGSPIAHAKRALELKLPRKSRQPKVKAMPAPQSKPAFVTKLPETVLDPVTKTKASGPADYSSKPLGKQPCQWPDGHPDQPDFHFCGKSAVRGKPYCADHCSAAYVVVKPRVSEAA